ncbi:unnamed protein product [Lactuca saligna]|uniref:Uncharacterized protein n=1 Tax=Lactuca saligna TaxID=75948 RepID=A0AA35YQI1_LACSI|nr:unnamed protein product [Lactuca saligna]
MILFPEFEYSHTSYVYVAVSSVGISSIPVTSNLSQPDPSRIDFFLLPDELFARYNHEFEQNPDLCALDIKFITVLFTFQDLSPPHQSSFNKSYNVTYLGKYSLYFANCNDLSLVTMEVRTELSTTPMMTKDYLSARQPHPSLLFRLFLIDLCFLGVWIYISLKNQQCFKRIHLLMAGSSSHKGNSRGQNKKNFGPKKQSFKKPGHQNPNSKPKRAGPCHIFGEMGHYARECKDRKSVPVAHAVEKVTDMVASVNLGEIFMISSLTRAICARGWFVDTGATVHVCGHRERFNTYQPKPQGTVVIYADGHRAEVLGKGDVQLKFTRDGA